MNHCLLAGSSLFQKQRPQKKFKKKNHLRFGDYTGKDTSHCWTIRSCHCCWHRHWHCHWHIPYSRRMKSSYPLLSYPVLFQSTYRSTNPAKPSEQASKQRQTSIVLGKRKETTTHSLGHSLTHSIPSPSPPYSLTDHAPSGLLSRS